MLFPLGKRPAAELLVDWAGRSGRFAVSHVPTVGDTGQPGVAWAELLLDGLTFDIDGLHPGIAVDTPEVVHHFDCAPGPDHVLFESLRLIPGPHLSGGERSLPIIRTMLQLVCLISEQADDLDAVIWSPAKAMIGTAYFRRIVNAWLDGGAFPALGLTAFKPTVDDGLQSEGLAFFTGQELRIEPELATDKADATRLAVRLVNQLVPLGRLDGPEIVTAPDGRVLRLAPSINGRFVRVREG